MGEVSIFYADDKFGKAGTISLGKVIQPCFTVKIGDLVNNAEKKTTGIIATNFDIKKTENISVTPTLGTQLFLYVGGESAWEISIQGLVLHACEEEQGFKNIMNWYNKNNVKETGKPIDLTLGESVYKGYLHRFELASDYKFTNCFSFTATFIGVLEAPADPGGK